MPVLDPGAGSDLPVVICAVSGLGGVGKTSLAVFAARKAVQDGWFPGGTLFLDFLGYDAVPIRAEQALLTLLDGLGVRGADLPRTTAAQYNLYRTLLEERLEPTLLILDNASDPAQLVSLLPGTDRHRVLITSRDRLTDLDARLIDLDTLAPEASAALIAKLLLLSDDRDDRPSREPEAVAALAVVCGHHPLALRVVVGALRKRRYRTIASFVEELTNAADLTGSLRIRPVLDTAYRQLPLRQARLLRQLAVAPTSEVGTEAATALSGIGATETSDLLDELAASHLVTAEPTKGDGRWRLHDLVRAYAAEITHADPVLAEEGRAARQRVLAFFCRRTEAAAARLRWQPGEPDPEWFPETTQAAVWLKEAQPALVGAVQWAREEQFADAAVRLAVHLSQFLVSERHFDDFRTVSQAVQHAGNRFGDLLGDDIEWDSFNRALMLVRWAEEAIAAHVRARGLSPISEEQHEAIALNGLGIALLSASGQPDEALDAHTRALALFASVGDRQHEGISLDSFGTALSKAGLMQQAIDAHTRALDMFRSVDDRHHEAIAWYNLGQALRSTGEKKQAITAFEQALGIHQSSDDWYLVGEVHEELGHLYDDWEHPDWDRAVAHYRQAVDAYTRANAPTHAARVRVWLGHAY